MRTRAVLVPVALAVTLLSAACSSSTPAPKQSAHSASTSALARTSAPVPTPTTPASPARSSSKSSPTASHTKKPAASTSTHAKAAAHASSATLPLSQPTHNATQLITVTANSTGDTTGTLQAWSKSGHGWQRYGNSVEAHLGSDGLSRHPSESISATPIGSFTLTQAFGHDSDPGTSLKYTHTTPDDWWISQPGSLYNTRQRCSSGCNFNRGDPNEHLYYETPFYNYAVVIDYNTRNAPGGVHQGAGSAFFLHVTDGNSTAGCVSIPQDKLTHLMRWLDPSRHPRILIGVG
jgi:L,D-peptidoglycan transpeptidase YkuD (ErfK/YbiS/YcfS/YnhG family)